MKPSLSWTAFVVAVALGFGAMLWLSRTVLELDRAQVGARQQAMHEESVRLALWRMETALAPIVARESARSYLAYEAFHNPERAYDSLSQSPANPAFVVPSPLLEHTPEPVLVHFQVGPGGEVSSPQVPGAGQMVLATNAFGNTLEIPLAESRLTGLKTVLDYRGLIEGLPAADDPPMPRRVVAAASSVARQTVEQSVAANQQVALDNNDFWQRGQRQADYQSNLNAAEWNTRVVQQEMAQQRVKGGKGGKVPVQVPNERAARPQEQQSKQAPQGAAPLTQPPAVSEGLMKALWVDGRLLLARRVLVSNVAYVQGCWLDWDRLKGDLLAEVRDLLPGANLVPVGNGEPFDSRRLAALPARLIPGPAPAVAPAGLSPVQLFLLLTWVALAAAAGATALLLAGAMRLSERRAAFVSAVTHELRTPLTTFRMYAEMLAEGMVPDPAKREHYLRTLCAESNRLSHLVENVLAYARLERGATKGRTEQATVQGILDRVMPRLEERAAQCEMNLSADCPPDAASTGVMTDVSAVEQILFNLIDNACKYAGKAGDRSVRLSVQPVAGKVVFRVQDHGPGIAPEDERRLFRPFSKSAQRAAESAPGVGLGLALCRRLAGQIGGRLEFVRMSGGACFELTLSAVGRRNTVAPLQTSTL
jgi:signal transduction histidine kinase